MAAPDVMTPQSLSDRARADADETALLAHILDERAVFPLFQPIVDLQSRKIVAVEALARGPAGSTLELPGALFDAAIRQGSLAELDQMCFERALVAARDAGPVTPPLVFANAEPAGLTRPMTPELVAAIRSGLPFRVVLEFTERALATAPAAMLRVTDAVHSFGNAIALDDVGAEPLSLAFLPVLEPAVVKLDMHLLRRPHDPHTLMTAAAVSAFAERSTAIVLAEGIETEQDAVNAAALGARWGQGWLYGRPGPLNALAGRPVDHTVSLRHGTPLPAGGGLHSAFALSSQREGVRRGDQAMINATVGYVLNEVGGGEPNSVIACALSTSEDLSTWLPRLQALNAQAGYLATLTSLAVPAMAHAQTTAPTPDDPMNGETVIAFLGAYRTIALCIRWSATLSGLTEFTLTQNRDLVQNIVGTILRRFPSW